MTYVVNEAMFPWPRETLDLSVLIFAKGDVEVLVQRQLSEESAADHLDADLLRMRRSSVGFRALPVEPYDERFPGGRAVKLRFDSDDGPRFEAHLRFQHHGTMYDFTVRGPEELAEACVTTFETIARTLRVRTEDT